MRLGERVRVDSFVQMLDDWKEQLMLGEVCQPGLYTSEERTGLLSVGAIRGASHASPVTGRRASVHLRLWAQVGEVRDAKPALASGEIRLKDFGDCCCKLRRVFGRASAKPGTVKVFLACYAVVRSSWVLAGACEVCEGGMEPQKAQVLRMFKPKAHAGTCEHAAAISRRKTRLSSSSQLIAEGGCSMPVWPAE